jgi:hypothetical protein
MKNKKHSSHETCQHRISLTTHRTNVCVTSSFSLNFGRRNNERKREKLVGSSCHIPEGWPRISNQKKKLASSDDIKMKKIFTLFLAGSSSDKLWIFFPLQLDEEKWRRSLRFYCRQARTFTHERGANQQRRTHRPSSQKKKGKAYTVYIHRIGNSFHHSVWMKLFYDKEKIKFFFF